MWFELVDASWFEIDGMQGSVEDLIAHYEKINVSADFCMKIYNLRDVKFETWFHAYIINDYYRFILFDTNELILDIFMQNTTRRFYSDNVREFLFDLKMICGLTINSHPQILALADYIKYDFWFMNKCVNKF